MLLAWHLADLATQGEPPGGRGIGLGAPGPEVEGRRAASHYAFAKVRSTVFLHLLL